MYMYHNYAEWYHTMYMHVFSKKNKMYMDQTYKHSSYIALFYAHRKLLNNFMILLSHCQTEWS